MLLWLGLLATFGPVALLAQPASLPRWVVERTERARWTYDAEFMPRAATDERLAFFLDSVSQVAGIRQLHLRFTTPAQGAQSAVIRLGTDDRVLGATVIPVPQPASPFPANDTLTMVAWRHLPGRPALNSTLELPAARLRELLQDAGALGRSIGARWVDTVAWSVEVSGFRQELRGERHRLIVGDSMIDSRRHVIVRDSGQVALNEVGWLREFSLDSLTRLTRAASGRAVTHALIEEATGFIRLRVDTVALAGVATLRYVDGRSITAPVRFDLTRRWDGMTAGAHGALTAERRASRRRNAPGMVIAPTPLERRLQNGDPRLRDSLLTLVRSNPRDTANVARIRHLSFVPDSSGRLERELLDRQISAGDTNLLAQGLAQRSRPGPRYSRDDLQTLVGLLDRPDRLLAHGLVADDLLSSITPAIVWNPPVLGGGTPACELRACEALIAARDATHHPRTRDLALVMAAVVDPRRYADSVRARAREQWSPFREVLPMIRGTGATWLAAAGLPLPAPGADWREWIDWAQAPNPAYAQAMPARSPSPLPEGPRFEDSHKRALRYQQVLTGRDFVAEFREAYTRHTADSARLTFGTMLLGLGALRREWEELARELQTGGPAAVSLARAEVLARLTYAPTATERPEAAAPQAAELEDALVEMLSGEAPVPWPHIAERFTSVPSRSQPPRPVTGRVYVFDADRTPPSIIERWRGRIDPITPRAWEELPGTVSTIKLRVTRATRYGPFYSLSGVTDGRLASGGATPPSRYVAGTHLVVMRWNNRWWVIGSSSFVS